MTRVHPVLFATDFSGTSRRAFRVALELATSLGATLTIVHVMAPIIPAVPEVYLDGETIDRLEKQARQWATRQLDKLSDRAKRARVRVEVRLREGDPTAEIVRASRSAHARFIVMGTHGRRGMQRLLLGSVAERLVRTATCAVVTVRGRS